MKVIKFSIIILLAVAYQPVSAQRRVSLDEAVKMAMDGSRSLKIVDSNIMQIKAERGENLETGSTTLSYSWGQINGETHNDKQFEIGQSLGSLMTPFYKNKYVKTRVETQQYLRQMTEREVHANVQQAYVYYQYALGLVSLYQGYESLSAKLRHVADIRMKQGDITLLEQKMMTTLSADMHRKLLSAQQLLLTAKQKFQWACYSDESVVPADTVLMAYVAPTELPSPATTYINYFHSQTLEKKAFTKVERSRLFPELSLGYVRQTIEPLKGLNSFMVSVGIPIFNFSQHSRIRQAQIAEKTAQLQADEQKRQLDIKLASLRADIYNSRDRLTYFTSSAIPEADALISAVNAQLSADDISISDYIQSINSARDIRSSYLETLYQYNSSVIEYNLYNN
jgi:cobalt-zinc-cadmium resistance protein CzcA